MSEEKDHVLDPKGVKQLIADFGSPSDTKLAAACGVCTHTVFRWRHEGVSERRLLHLRSGLGKIKAGIIGSQTPRSTDDGWRDVVVNKDDLQFLIQVSQELTKPMTLGLVFDLLSKR